MVLLIVWLTRILVQNIESSDVKYKLQKGVIRTWRRFVDAIDDVCFAGAGAGAGEMFGQFFFRLL